MKTLYIDCSMGAAGDMLTAALLELVPDHGIFLSKVNSLLEGVEVKKEKTKKNGITGTQITVKINGKEEQIRDIHAHEHKHIHVHENGYHYDEPSEDAYNDNNKQLKDPAFFSVREMGLKHQEHRHLHHHAGGRDHSDAYSHAAHRHNHVGMQEIIDTVSKFDLSDKVKNDIIAVYHIIAKAESKAHDTDISQIHFHEVGDKDAVIDIASVCILMDMIKPDEVVVSPVHVGSGYVECAHGILPVPAPATAYILKDVPVYGGNVEGELCTPTGAALLKYFADRFSGMPYMITKSIGYGMGKKDFDVANCVRVILGDDGKIKEDADDNIQVEKGNNESVAGSADATADVVYELSFNVDDMTAEEIAYATEKIFDAGAKDVYSIAVVMKKGRPGTLIQALCYKEDKSKVIETIFKHTTTIGIREKVANRYVLDRKEEIIDTKFGQIRRKMSEGYGVRKTKYEYDDLKNAADRNGTSIYEIKKELENTGFPDEGV